MIGKESHLYDYGSVSSLYSGAAPNMDTAKSRLFVQYTCVQDAADQHRKYNRLCMSVATAVLIALLFTITIRYLFQGGKMMQIDWDMSTVTAGDYTVEFEI